MNLIKVLDLFRMKINYDDFEVFEEDEMIYARTDLEIDGFDEVMGVQLILTNQTAAILFAFENVLDDEKSLRRLNQFNTESSNVYRATIEDPDTGFNVLFLTSFFITNFLSSEEEYAEKLRIYFEDFGIGLVLSEIESLLKDIR